MEKVGLADSNNSQFTIFNSQLTARFFNSKLFASSSTRHNFQFTIDYTLILLSSLFIHHSSPSTVSVASTCSTRSQL